MTKPVSLFLEISSLVSSSLLVFCGPFDGGGGGAK
jgi:hypothetical protein